MNRQQFEYFLDAPDTLRSAALVDLELLLREYPFCQTLYLMVAKTLSLEDSVHFHPHLRMAAAYASDRTRLRQLITGRPMRHKGWFRPAHGKVEETGPSGREQALPEEASTPPVEIGHVRKLLVELETAVSGLTTGRSDISPDSRPMNVPEGERTQKSISKDQQEETSQEQLIERFLKEEPRIPPSRVHFFDPTDKARQSVQEHQDIVSETLARIYADQGNISKAIKIYQQLSLKFPEKSSYFVAQIKNLEKNTENS
jgi:hypothetical protein